MTHYLLHAIKKYVLILNPISHSNGIKTHAHISEKCHAVLTPSPTVSGLNRAGRGIQENTKRRTLKNRKGKRMIFLGGWGAEAEHSNSNVTSRASLWVIGGKAATVSWFWRKQVKKNGCDRWHGNVRDWVLERKLHRFSLRKEIKRSKELFKAEESNKWWRFGFKISGRRGD